MWVARDKEGLLVGFNHKPIRMNYNETGYYGWTFDLSQVPSPETDSINFQTQISRIILPSSLFPNLTWEDEPIEVELSVKGCIDNLIELNLKARKEVEEFKKSSILHIENNTGIINII